MKKVFSYQLHQLVMCPLNTKFRKSAECREKSKELEAKIAVLKIMQKLPSL